jgi:hypothetical protein
MVSKDGTMFSTTEVRRDPFNPSGPGCGRTHWLIGRLSAECAFCSTALPLKDAGSQGPAATPVFWSGRRPSYAELNAA